MTKNSVFSPHVRQRGTGKYTEGYASVYLYRMKNLLFDSILFNRRRLNNKLFNKIYKHKYTYIYPYTRKKCDFLFRTK